MNHSLQLMDDGVVASDSIQQKRRLLSLSLIPVD